MAEQMKLYREGGKRWTLPLVVRVERGFYFYKVLGFRPPKRGEWYLSGAVVEAYKSCSDLETPYLVIETTAKAVQRTVWEAA